MLIYPPKIDTEYGKDLIPKQNIYRAKKPWYYHHRCIDMIDLDKLTHNYIMYDKSELISEGWTACAGTVIRLMCFAGKNRAITEDMSMRQNKKNIGFLTSYVQNKVQSFYIKERVPFVYSSLFLKNRSTDFIWISTYKVSKYVIKYDNWHDGGIVLMRAERIAYSYTRSYNIKIGRSSFIIPYYRLNRSDYQPKDNRHAIGVLYNQLIYRFKVRPLTQIMRTVKGEDIKYHGTSI